MNFFKYMVLALSVAVLASCATPKEILYFQNIDSAQLQHLNTEYEAVIKKDDRLAIIVSGPDKMVTAPYNLTLGEMSNAVSNGNPEQSTLSYLVDSKGNIDFPILGKIHVEGMTRNQLVAFLTAEIGMDVKDPIVYVSFLNYKITVLGEVRSPGTFIMDSEKINVLQALGRAGDLQLTAKRDGILLIREENGVQKHYTIDLRDSKLMESPYFYLQQNDVLYIPPSSTRVAAATTATGVWGTILSAVSTTIALLSIILR